MSKTKRRELAVRTLTEIEVSGLRAVGLDLHGGRASNRDLVQMVEAIAASHRRKAWGEGFRRGRNPAPAWIELWGIDPDYTGRQDVNEWLDEQRGDA